MIEYNWPQSHMYAYSFGIRCWISIFATNYIRGSRFHAYGWVIYYINIMDIGH